MFHGSHCEPRSREVPIGRRLPLKRGPYSTPIHNRWTHPASPGNFFAATLNSRRSAIGWSRRRSKAILIKPRRTNSRGAGGYDFEIGLGAMKANEVRWTVEALPTVVQITTAPAGAADPKFQMPAETLRPLRFPKAGEHIVNMREQAFRVCGPGIADETPLAVLLPLDCLFDIRANAALRLWRTLSGRNPESNPAHLSPNRRIRLILALRVLDGRRARASYHQIAEAVLLVRDLKGSVWKSHDVRDRTIRLARYGQKLMNVDYRLLLLHPYRRLK